MQHVDWSDTTGTIRFVQGTCTLQATAEGLALRVEADDEDTLRRLQDGIARRLDTIGRHDHLAVHWQQSAPESRQDSGGPPEDATTATATATSTGGTTRRPRPTRRLLVLAAVATLAILVHLGVLGVLGAALTTSAWAGWGTNITIAVIVVTIVVMGLHGVLGRVAFRRRSSIREK